MSKASGARTLFGAFTIAVFGLVELEKELDRVAIPQFDAL
jgi:hypothetical protein